MKQDLERITSKFCVSDRTRAAVKVHLERLRKEQDILAALAHPMTLVSWTLRARLDIV